MNTWNIVENGNTKKIWKSIEDTNYSEIKLVEQEINSEPYYCLTSKSVVFVTTNKDINVVKKENYSELELISRYLTTETKLYDLLKS